MSTTVTKTSALKAVTADVGPAELRDLVSVVVQLRGPWAAPTSNEARAQASDLADGHREDVKE